MAAGTVAIDLGGLGATFDAGTGKFGIRAGDFRLEELCAGFETSAGKLSGPRLAWEILQKRPDGFRVRGSAAGLALWLDFALLRRDVAGAALPALDVSARVTGAKPFSLERIIIMESAASILAPGWIYIHDRTIMGDAGTMGTQEARSFQSWHVHAWTDGDRTLFFSFPLRQSFPSHVAGRIELGRIREFSAVCGVQMDGLDEVQAPTLSLAATSAPHEFIEHYGDMQRAGRGRTDMRRPIAWNSWDYALGTVSEKYVLDHLDFIDNDPVLGEAVEYIVVDGGWAH